MLVWATGCSNGTNSEPIDLPSKAMGAAFYDAKDDPLIQFSDSLPPDWWTLFNDSQLTEFIETTFEQNPTLQKAEANILLACNNARRLRSNLFPNLNLGADVLREKLSETGLIPFNTSGTTVGTPGIIEPGGFAGIPVYFTQYETEFILTYEFDLWKKNRNTLLAALGEVQARLADEAFTRLQLGIAVASVYYQLQIDYKRQEIADAIVENRVKYLDMVHQRVEANLDNIQTQYEAEINLTTVKTQLLEIQGDIAVNEYQLKAYLAGDFNEDIFQVDIASQPLPQVPLPVNIPVHLISNRPDITSQIWLIESAGRQIQVAKAGFYPDFNITALFGFQTIHLAQLFKWPSSYYTVDPAVTLPIFDAGRLTANLNMAEINYDLAIYQYNNLVINAVKEVLDGLAVLRNVEAQFQEFKKQAERQVELLNLTSLLVTNNVSSSLDFLTREEIALLAMDQKTVAYGNTIQSILTLIKALGGGYDACYFKG